MALKESLPRTLRRATLAGLLIAASGLGLASCNWQPLHGGTYDTGALPAVYVTDVDTRTGQQVRNHLVFLFDGGRGSEQPPYEVRLRVTDSTRAYAASRAVRTVTAGSVTVVASYDLVETATNNRIGGGSRTATASFDRTGQNFANERAEIDAQDRAAKEVAERLRLAIAADLTRR